MANYKIPAEVIAERRRRAIEMVAAAAREGLRCPTNDEIGHGVLPILAREGIVKIDVYAHNWRTVTMMTGPLKGKRTAPPPIGSGQPYRTIYKDSVSPPRAKPVNQVLMHADTAILGRE